MKRSKSYNLENVPKKVKNILGERRQLNQSNTLSEITSKVDNQLNVHNHEQQDDTVYEKEILTNRNVEQEAVSKEVEPEFLIHEETSFEVTSKDTEIIKLKIQDAIQNIKYKSQISVGGEAPGFPSLPGLSIKGYGTVFLPINETNAKEIIKFCKQAPYGRNHETLVDTAVRDTFQLDPSQVKIENPEWNKKLKVLTKDVAMKLLGRTNDLVHAKLYKVLLYQKGGHFKKHRDTEKEKDMFATLVIQLPSKYSGGELVVWDDDDNKVTYDFGQSTSKANFQIFYAAHYADIEHELLEIKSGYRLVLVYSMCWPGGNIVNHNKTELALDVSNALDAAHQSASNVFSMYLEHRYTASSLGSLGINAMKGIDAERVHFLKVANEHLSSNKKYNFYIIHSKYELSLECDGYGVCRSKYGLDNSDNTSNSDDDGKIKKKTKSGKGGKNQKNKTKTVDLPDNISDRSNESVDEDWSLVESNERIDEWYTENGRNFIKDVSLEVKCISQLINPHKTNKKPWLKHKEVDVGGYTGNEGASKLTTYHKYFLLFCPESIEDALLIRFNSEKMLEDLYKSSESSLSINELNEKLKNILILMRKQAKLDNFNAHALNYLLKSLYKCNNAELASLFFNEIVAKFNMKLISHCDSDEPVFDCIKLYGLELIKLGMRVFYNEKLLSAYSMYEFSNGLIKSGSGLAVIELLELCFKPMLVDDVKMNEFLNEITFHNYARDKSTLYKIILMLIELKKIKPELDEILRILKENIVKFLNENSLNSLLEEMADEKVFEKFETSPTIHELFQQRVKSMLDNPIFSPESKWSMPLATIPGYPEIEEFFASDKIEMKFNTFQNREEAKEFVKKYEYCGADKHFTAQIELVYVKKVPFVKIKKTGCYYNTKLNIYETYDCKLKKFQSTLSKFKI